MKIVFMGTPDFAVYALKAIVEAGHEITAVVTQPDKPKGRSDQLSFSPVKEYALKMGLPVFQPIKIKRPEAVAELAQYEADVFVVAAFGQILSKEILCMPKYGCLNIHASLLPKYRGSSPIQWAVINGEAKSGVTIQQMNEGIDTGEILYQKEYELTHKETGASLFTKLALLGAVAIKETLNLLQDGKLNPVPQDEQYATHTVMLHKEMGEIDFHKSAVEIERLVRGLNSWPSAYTFYNGKQLKIWDADVVPATSNQNELSIHNDQPGTLISISKEDICILCGEDVLKVNELQLEGKKRMSTHDFLIGNHVSEGMILGKREA